MNRKLYDIHPIGSRELNMIAHPGGGTEVTEVPSFEGLVEDQFESHLRHLEVAYKEPVAIRMAHLSRQLETAGMNKISAIIDELSYNFIHTAAPDEQDQRAIAIKKLTEVDMVIRNESDDIFGYEQKGKEEEILARINDCIFELEKQTPDINKIRTNLSFLLHKDLLFGTWRKAGEVDLESSMSKHGFRLYLNNLKYVGSYLKALEQPSPKDVSPQRSVPPSSLRDKSRIELAQELYSTANSLYRTLNDINNNAKTMANLGGDVTAKKINSMFSNTWLHNELRKFNSIMKELEAAQTAGITEIQYNSYRKYLEQFQSTLNNLEKFLYDIEKTE